MDDHGRNLYLRRKYGITLAEYNEILEKQGGVCAICLRPGKTRALAVDHDHKAKYTKIIAEQNDGGSDAKWAWKASAVYPRFPFPFGGRTKTEAIRRVRQELKRLSVRGLLCPHCNSGLRKYADDPLRLQRAANYLTRFQNPSI